MEQKYDERQRQLLDDADALAELATFETDVDTAVDLHRQAVQKYQEILNWMLKNDDRGPLSRYTTRRILEHRQLAGLDHGCKA